MRLQRNAVCPLGYGGYHMYFLIVIAMIVGQAANAAGPSPSPSHSPAPGKKRIQTYLAKVHAARAARLKKMLTQ